MESNNTQSNQTNAVDLDYWFSYYGATFSIDIMYMYFLTPLSILAFILNSISFYILSKADFSLSIFYSYLKLQILNSIILSALLITAFACNTYRIFDFTNTFEALAYGAYFHTPVVSIFYFYSTLLEICIALERSLKFFPAKFRFKKINNFNNVCLLMFLFSALINIPSGFVYYPSLAKVKVGNKILNLYYWGLTDFSLSVFGKVITYLVYIVRDIGFLVLKIVINVYSVYVVRQYLTKITVNSFTLLSITKRGEVILSTPKKEYLTQTDRNLTYMSIWMCVLSVLENIFYAFAYTYYSVNQNEASLTVFFFSFFTLALKHVSNFFVLYFYNNSFRAEFRKKFFRG